MAVAVRGGGIGRGAQVVLETGAHIGLHSRHVNWRKGRWSSVVMKEAAFPRPLTELVQGRRNVVVGMVVPQRQERLLGVRALGYGLFSAVPGWAHHIPVTLQQQWQQIGNSEIGTRLQATSTKKMIHPTSTPSASHQRPPPPAPPPPTLSAPPDAITRRCVSPNTATRCCVSHPTPPPSHSERTA